MDTDLVLLFHEEEVLKKNGQNSRGLDPDFVPHMGLAPKMMGPP